MRTHTFRIFSIPGFSRGGVVVGPGTSTSDSVPTNLSNGEGVLNAGATKKMGKTELDRRNEEGSPEGTIPSTERRLMGTAEGLLKKGHVHLTEDTPLPIGSRFEMETNIAEGSLHLVCHISKSGRDLARRGTDCSIERSTWVPAAGAIEQGLDFSEDRPYGATDLELECGACVLNGLPYKVVAEQLDITTAVVGHHMRDLFGKIENADPSLEIDSRESLILHSPPAFRKAMRAALNRGERARAAQ